MNDITPLDPFGHDEDDETAALLRGALVREAQRVAPSPDGLQRIQREIRSGQVRRRSGLTRLLPVLTAAAAVAVLAVAGAVAVRLNQPQGGQAAPATGSTTLPTASPEAPRGQVPVYVVGTQGGQKWLFREFRSSRARTVDEKVADAVTKAVNERPADPDYDPPLFQGGPNSEASATVTASQITVTLTAAMVSRHDATRAQARLALEQVVWTATAAAGAGSDTPVRITVDRGNQSLFGLLPLGRDYRRSEFTPSPRAPLWISSLVESTDVGHTRFEVSGDALVGADGEVSWVLTRNGQQVGQGHASLGQTVGSRQGWSLVPPTNAVPGSYLLTVRLTPGSDTGLSTAQVWEDTRNFVIQ